MHQYLTFIDTALFDFYLLNVHVEILQFIVRFRIQS